MSMSSVSFILHLSSLKSEIRKRLGIFCYNSRAVYAFLIIQVSKAQQGPYSQHFISFVTNTWAQ
jgi:hypothetical protein